MDQAKGLSFGLLPDLPYMQLSAFFARFGYIKYLAGNINRSSANAHPFQPSKTRTVAEPQILSYVSLKPKKLC